VLTLFQRLHYVLFALAVTNVGCHAQTGSPVVAKPVGTASVAETSPLSPDMAWRIEVLIRSKSDVPSSYEFHAGAVTASEIPGYDAVTVNFTSADGKASKPISFLLSKDRKTLAQLTKFDISKDPKTTVSAENRPARGGPENAPVLIVVFDDLECPFCARSNENLFPAVPDRYKDQVRIVYRDFPLDQHPWAMRAAVDANCVAAQSGTGYWNLIDYIHAHAGEIGTPEKTVDKAKAQLDTLAREEGKKQQVDGAKLDACLAKQDTSIVRKSMLDAEVLGVQATPALFINGERFEGALPIADIYRAIDGALLAAGQTPPPASSKPAAVPAIQTKPGN
jgi:protein-disulfide isomerase